MDWLNTFIGWLVTYMEVGKLCRQLRTGSVGDETGGERWDRWGQVRTVDLEIIQVGWDETGGEWLGRGVIGAVCEMLDMWGNGERWIYWSGWSGWGLIYIL